MSNRFASDKRAIAICDVCGFRFRLKELRELIVKFRKTNIMACPSCWNPDHPQLKLGTFPVDDPQALRNPRPDSNQRFATRDIQWGWNPVGGPRFFDDALTPNTLAIIGQVGTVTIETT